MVAVFDESDYLAHYGILRKSGRYPWGSGKDVPARNRQFLDIVADLRKGGMSNQEIAEATGLKNDKGEASSTVLRDLETIAKNRDKAAKIARVWSLTDHGMSNGEIAKAMGLPGESSVRALKAPGLKERAAVIQNTADSLKKDIDTHRMIDIGAGVENHMGISKEQLRAAATLLKEQEGFKQYRLAIPQLGTGNDTQMKALCAPDVTYAEVQRNKYDIQHPTAVTARGERKKPPTEYPVVSIDPKRVGIVYKEDGGDKKDGVVLVRPGVEDISLGNARYAQVRVMVGGSHYIKGMAMYDPDLPKGTDLLFHTAKAKADLGPDKLEALKPLNKGIDGKIDKEFPFKTVVKPVLLDRDTPNERRTGMNVVFEEGDWGNWSKSLSSQFLSKQSPTLARTQLQKNFDKHKADYDEIMSLTNPAVKKKLLAELAESADSASVHLEAARLHTEQRWHVILPIDKMPPGQVFAPNYENGTRVVLVRFPHAGTFEIPELVVNNKHPQARKILEGVPDAIGIHHSVAERLSGADFDGDTVIVIPNPKNLVKTTPALEALKGFNPKTEYPKYDGMKVITAGHKQQEMGKISNLITDMQLQGASNDQLARAVKHSMVIIDAEKHQLDYKRSYTANGIAALKAEYQGGANRGAATLISRAGSEVHRDQHRLARVGEGAAPGGIDPITGRKMLVPSGKTRRHVAPNGQIIETKVGEKKPRLAIEPDAKALISDKNTRMEQIYATHSNDLKDLANQARLALIKTPTVKQNASAKAVYKAEVDSLNAQLHLAQMNAPLERRAQAVAGAAAKAKKEANPNIEKDTYKKVKYRELDLARMRVGAQKYQIQISQREWDAIQAGAISNAKLNEILAHTDIEVVRKYATPKAHASLGTAQVNRAQMMLAAGNTRAEVAAQLGVSTSTLDRALQGGES